MRSRSMVMTMLALLGGCLWTATAVGQRPELTFSAKADNDLVRVAEQCGINAQRFDSPEDAVRAAAKGAGVLILADDYPAETTELVPALFEKAFV